MPWYIRAQNKIFGPLSDDDLRRLAQEQRLTAAHLVGKSAQGPWVKASRVKGLAVPPSNLTKTATAADPNPGNPLRTDAGRLETVQDGQLGLQRRHLIFIGAILTVLFCCVVVAARALVSSLYSDRADVIAKTTPDTPTPKPPVLNKLKPFNIVTRIERTSRLEKMHPVEAAGKFPHDRPGTDDFLRHQKLVFEEKEVTECAEEAFDEPLKLSDYGDNQEFIKQLSRQLKDTALAITRWSESTVPRRYIAQFETLAFLVSDLPEDERAAIRRFAQPASVRFAEGVSAAISESEAARHCAKELEKIVQAVTAIAAEPGGHAEKWLRTPPREAIAKLDTVRNSIGMEFRLIPSGTFLMGTADQGSGNESPDSEDDKLLSETRAAAQEDEKPAHQVTVTQPFYMGVKEVSYSQFDHVMRDSSAESTRPQEINEPKKIEAFLERLSDMPEEKAAGRKYRLPTEAEWEYACRAGTSTTFSFGEDAKWLVLYKPSYYFSYRLARCNAWGLYGMHDETQELVSDRYGPYTGQPQTDPRGASFGPQRVARGGRSASRHAVKLDDEGERFNTYVCFRVVFDAPSAGARRAGDVQALVADGKLEEADKAFRDVLELGAERASIRASALALAQGWLTYVDVGVATGGTSTAWANQKVSDTLMAGCSAVKAACTSACEHGCSEMRVHPLLAHQLLLQAIILDKRGETETAITRLLDAIAADASMADRIGFSVARPKELVTTQQQQGTGRKEDAQRAVHLPEKTRVDAEHSRVRNLGVEDPTRVSELAGGSLLFKPTSGHSAGDLIAPIRCKLDARLRQAALDSWRKRLDAAILENDATLAFQLIGDGMWLDAEFITNLPPVRNSIGMEFKLIPAGEFNMGDPFGEKDESPHTVVLSRAFFIGTHELKNVEVEQLRRESSGADSGATEQKERVKKDEDRRKPIIIRQRSRTSDAGKDESPVEGLAWETAVKLCGDISKLPAESAGGRYYRLPTEAEWEYACRAGSTTRWSFGNDETLFSEYGWRDGKEGASLHPVGKKKPNAWGLFDMHGNASEWVADWYDDYPTRKQQDPHGPDERRKAGKVFRGGSCFAENAGLCRSAYRGRGYETRGQGVRIALTPVSSRPVVVSATERLAQKISLTLAGAPLGQAILVFSDEVGLPVIVDSSVFNEGISSWTPISVGEQAISATEMLNTILSAADKKNQLESLVRLENGYEVVYIYRREKPKAAQ